MDDLHNEEILNFVRLHSILLPRVCQVLRKLFRATWRSCTGAKWEDSAAQGTKFIEGVGKKFYEDEPDKFKEKLASGCLDEWDVTLVCHILLNFDFGDARALNRTQKSKIRRVLEIRNYLAHHGTNRINNEEFRDKWLQIENILNFFGFPENELHSMRSNFDTFDDSNVAKAQRLNDKGNTKFKSGQYREAVSYYSEALGFSDIPKMDSARFRSNRAAAYLKLASYDKDTLVYALEDAKMAVQLRPDWHKSLFRLGCVYREMEKYEKALKLFSSILQYEPGDEIVKKARVFCLEQIYA